MRKAAYLLNQKLSRSQNGFANLFNALFFWVLLFCCSSNIGQAKEINYRSFHNIEEVIAYETTCIENIPSLYYEQLSDAYASRGESFLLCDRFNEALHDFEMAYETALSLEDSAIFPQLKFRALFGQAIAFGCLNEVDKVQDISYVLMNTIPLMFCESCQESIPEHSISCKHMQYQSRLQIVLCEDTPIYGPDEVSVQDCLDFIKNTENLCKLLIEKSPKISQFTLRFVISQLADAARNCCYQGGIWKGCVQPLVNKFHVWNQKWQIFRIPPDPTWD